ncbi:ASCH domain-containing protein [Paucibacter sp. B2R-40]|uniref:ASCH domain-containing protein n=1 Tax=Paucibacter sp. B2R-40 TaxID=2893554 RepID=UPI0021E3D581|nr:ASCH domain-containing protein [Paucibacter sp. B2R-40]MCV2356561.1 ASCH domain-containing protein [Paucibacter sp. B2R-40]
MSMAWPLWWLALLSLVWLIHAAWPKSKGNSIELKCSSCTSVDGFDVGSLRTEEQAHQHYDLPVGTMVHRMVVDEREVFKSLGPRSKLTLWQAIQLAQAQGAGKNRQSFVAPWHAGYVKKKRGLFARLAALPIFESKWHHIKGQGRAPQVPHHMQPQRQGRYEEGRAPARSHSLPAARAVSKRPPASLSTIAPPSYRQLTQSCPATVMSAAVPQRGLVIHEYALARILEGRKRLELRGRHNRQLGPVALIRKGSGQIVGVADIVDSIGPLSLHELSLHSAEHSVEPTRLREVFDKGWVYGWRLANVRKLSNPVPYLHKGMSQVKLDDAAVRGLALALRDAMRVAI